MHPQNDRSTHMIRILRSILLATSLLSATLPLHAQRALVERSLRELEQHSAGDGTRLQLLTDLAEAYMSVEPVKADSLLTDAITLGRRLDDPKGLARALSLHGELVIIRYQDPGPGATSVQEAERLHQTLGDRGARAVDLTLLANLVFDEQGADSATDLLRKAEPLLIDIHDASVQGMVLAAHATHALNMELPDSALRCSERARAIFHAAEDIARENRMIAQAGAAHIGAGRNNLALPLLMEAMLADSISGCGYRQGIELSMSGNIHADMGNSAKAVELYMRAARTFEHINDLSGMAAVLNNAAIVYFNMGMHAEASSTYTEALEMAVRSGNDRWASNILMNLGEVHVANGDHDLALEYIRKSMALNAGRFPEAFASMHEIMSKAFLGKGYQDSAIIHLRTAIASHGGSDEVSLQARCMIALARTLREASPAVLISAGVDPTQLDNLVSNALDSALAVGRSAPLLEVQRDALYELALGAEQRGDDSGALRYFKMSSALKDSLLTGDKVKAVADVRFLYDTEKKEEQIALEREVQAKEIQKQKVIRNSFVLGFALMVAFAGVFFFQRNRISKERKRSEELLLNILPEEVAEELKAKGEADAKLIDSVTVLFTDFKGFTAMSEQLTPKELVRDIHECFSAFDRIMEKHGIEKIKTIGDAYMAAGGLPTPNTTHSLDVVKAALEIRDFIAHGKVRRVAAGQPHFEIRIGVHTGPVVAGIVGVKKFAYDIWGDTVNTASRMESSGEVGQVNISGITYALVKDEQALLFVPRGKVQAKGKGEMEMYFVERG